MTPQTTCLSGVGAAAAMPAISISLGLYASLCAEVRPGTCPGTDSGPSADSSTGTSLQVDDPISADLSYIRTLPRPPV